MFFERVIMSSFAYYDSNNVRVETTQRGVLDLVRSGAIKPSTQIEFDGKVYSASDFPSLQKIFKEIEAKSPKEDSAEPLIVVDLEEKRKRSKNPEENPDDPNGKRDDVSPPREEKVGSDQATGTGPDPIPKDDSNSSAVCPNCGAPTKGTPFCARCGAALNEIFCPNCGTKSTGASFCSRCGTPLGAGRRSQRSPYGPSGANRSSKIGFFESLTVCFKKFADFSGRAGMEEYWYIFVWLLLFNFLT